jgi:Spy/CpxP family protein refolding chaperone
MASKSNATTRLGWAAALVLTVVLGLAVLASPAAASEAPFDFGPHGGWNLSAGPTGGGSFGDGGGGGYLGGELSLNYIGPGYWTGLYADGS